MSRRHGQDRLPINALNTLGLLGNNFYDLEEGAWYIETPSPVLPISKILPNGEIVSITMDSET